MPTNTISKVITMKFAAIAALLTLASGSLYAQNVEVKNAWVRASVQGQKATGAFMQITASQPTTLVGAASPVAGVAEVHEMKMDGDVMRMRALPQGLPLPAGKAVALTPGGYHVMLMDLKQQVKVGDEVPLTLTIENKDGSRATIELKAAARPLNAPMKMHH